MIYLTLTQKISIKPSYCSAETHNLHNFRPATSKKSDASADREILLKRNELDDGTVVLHTGSIQDSNREHSVGSAMRQEELSLPQSTVGEFTDKVKACLNWSFTFRHMDSYLQNYIHISLSCALC